MSSDIVSQGKYTLLSKLSTPVLAFVLLMVIARQSDQLLGQYSIVLTYYFVLQVIPLFGLTPYLVREVGRAPEKAGLFLINIGLLSIVGCLILLILIKLTIPLTDYDQEVIRSIELVSLAIFPGILVFIGDVLLVALGKAKPASLIVVSENILRLVLSVWVLSFSSSIENLFWVLFLSKLVSMFVFFLYFGMSQDLLGDRTRFEWGFLQGVFKVLPVFFATSVLYLVVGRTDFFMLSFYQETEEVGYYAISYRLLEICMIAVHAICMVLLPKLSRLKTSRPTWFARGATTLGLYFILAVFLVSLAGVMFSHEYVKWFFPDQYDSPVLLAILFSVILLVYAFDFFLSFLLHASNQEKVDLKAMTIGSICFIVSLFFLVPTYGKEGAFIACAIIPFAQSAAKLWLTNQRLFVGNIWPQVYTVTLALGLTLLVAFQITEWSMLSRILSYVGLSCLVYVVLTAFGILRITRHLNFISSIFRVPDRQRNPNLDGRLTPITPTVS